MSSSSDSSNNCSSCYMLAVKEPEDHVHQELLELDKEMEQSQE